MDEHELYWIVISLAVVISGTLARNGLMSAIKT